MTEHGVLDKCDKIHWFKGIIDVILIKVVKVIPVGSLFCSPSLLFFYPFAFDFHILIENVR